MLKPRIVTSKGRTLKAQAVVADRRISGRKLQKRRWDLWRKTPFCACCGRVVSYPDGFELDHKTPLFLGGEDIEDNCQLLCVWFDMVDGALKKFGCHANKTSAEAPR